MKRPDPDEMTPEQEESCERISDVMEKVFVYAQLLKATRPINIGDLGTALLLAAVQTLYVVDRAGNLQLFGISTFTREQLGTTALLHEVLEKVSNHPEIQGDPQKMTGFFIGAAISVIRYCMSGDDEQPSEQPSEE